MDAGKPTVLLVGPHGDSTLEIAQRLLETCGIEARTITQATDAVDLAVAGKADAVVYWEAADLTGPETFEAIRWGYSTAGFVYIHAASDPLKDRLIEDVRAIRLLFPYTLRALLTAVTTVSRACKTAPAGGKAPA
jgi:hypothetical protein